MPSVSPPPLVALTPGELRSGGGGLALVQGLRPWMNALEAALAAGLPGVLVREPALLDGDFLELLHWARECTSSSGAWLGVHDRAHLVGAARADGLHLGFRSLQPSDARRVLGSKVGIGLSTHAGDDPRASAACQWRSLSPVYDTPSKRGLLDPLGPENLRALIADGLVPAWALGGLTPARVGEVLAAGAKGVFVRGALLGSKDPAAATEEFLSALEEHKRA